MPRNHLMFTSEDWQAVRVVDITSKSVASQSASILSRDQRYDDSDQYYYKIDLTWTN